MSKSQATAATRHRGLGSRLFLAWRRTLSHIARGTGAAVHAIVTRTALVAGAPWRAARSAFPVATAMLADGAGALAAPRHVVARANTSGRRRLLFVGVLSVTLGAFGAAFVGLVRGDGAQDIVLAVASIAGWAFVRLLLLRWTAPADVPRENIDAGWGAGALPWLIAVTPWLQAAAFVASAVQTYRALVGAGAERARSALMTTVAFGAQILLSGVSWLLGAGLLVYLAGSAS